MIRIQNLKVVLFAAILSSCVGWVTEATAAHTFYCKATIASDADWGPETLYGPLVYDMSPVGSCTNWEHIHRFNRDCEDPAHDACSTKASNDPSFNSAAFWCAKGVPTGSTIRAYAEVGANGKYKAAQTHPGVLINTPQYTTTVTTCTCPHGWFGDNGVDGGVTTSPEHRCAKNACAPITITPLPPQNSMIGSGSQPWGFSWGNAFYAFSNSTNGGAPNCVDENTVHLAVCQWQ
jgi:hypothetical protein